MNRIIHYVTFLLVISLLCGCSVDGRRTGDTTDTGRTGINPQTTVTTAEENPTDTASERTEDTVPSLVLRPYDFVMPGALREKRMILILDEAERAAFADAIGDASLNNVETLTAFLEPIYALYVPCSSDFGADYITKMLWDPGTQTVTVTYHSGGITQDSTPTVQAELVHELAADAEQVRAKLDADGTVTTLNINPTADAIYLHRDNVETLEVTVIKEGQVMRLSMFGDDTELRMARLSDADFTYSDAWEGFSADVPRQLQYKSIDDFARLFTVPDMDDAAFAAYCAEDSRSMNGISTREDADHVMAMLSPVRLPMVKGVLPEYLFCIVTPELDAMMVNFNIGNADGRLLASIRIARKPSDSAVTDLYIRRLTERGLSTAADPDWMPIGDDIFCTLIDGMYVWASINLFADFTIEDLTFGETIQSLSHPTIDRSHIQYAYVAELESDSRIHLVQLKSPDIDVAAYLASYAAENASFAKIGYDISAPLDETTVYIDRTADGNETDVHALQTGDVIGWIPNGVPMETYPAGYSDAPQYIEILRHTNQE